ncbi:hypothetical protein [Olleya sp. Bg11-27]|uniref:hypothetical protein n=1 Tax=Olleya sp. Bg11-27 TaxID=2058135 RepID=UPI000C309082|nr:hypothetical protein [Olleya sp. Bg11-27]AUC75013.1 hypothetical protein CW732_04710 [Olleya sp. Bg11-27]
MNELNEIELIFIKKLLNKVKYGNLNLFESNQFANSPIGNSILEKIELKFEHQFSEIKKRNNNAGISEFRYEYDNYVGKAILERLNEMDKSSFQAISKWDEKQTEKFAKDILGPIKYEKSELLKLTEFLTEKSKEKTSG